MHHFNAIMQSRHVGDLSTSDTYGAIRGDTNVTDVLAAQQVAILIGPHPKIWCTSTSAARVHVTSGGETESVGLEFFRHAFFLIYPSVCRRGNSSWKVEQESGFYAYGEHSS